uniref:G-protein coupled receptors family 1 profile domain-containing protein n=1 Tax=Pelodiscus sinensis TaxID=13735 RepID=K7G9D1_PELSI
MDEANWTSISEFVFSGVSDRQELQPLIFAGLLATYLVNVIGNSMLLGLMWANPLLRTPMYFLLSQLAIADMCMVSVIVPQALVHILTQHGAISFTGCMVQLFICVAMGNMGGYLLALCLKMVAASWAVVIPHALLHTIMIAELHYCGNCLRHFFCDLPP